MGRIRKHSPIDRFWTKVLKTDSCWLWQAGTFSNGYGQFFDGKRKIGAHSGKELFYVDNLTLKEAVKSDSMNLLKTVFLNGKLLVDQSLSEIRARLVKG